MTLAAAGTLAARLRRGLAATSWLAAGALVSPAFASQPASASPEQEGRPARAPNEASVASHHRRGVEHYDAGEYARALAEFERAYALSSDYRFLFNIGQLEYELHRFARARVSLERYLDEGRGLIPDARGDAVANELAELEGRTGVVMVQLDGAQTLLEVQGQRSSASHEVRFIVDTGPVRIVARRPGFAPIERVFDVVGGALVTLAIEFVAPRAAPQARSAPEPAAASEIHRAASPLAPIAWTLAGVAGLGAVGAGTATWLSSNHYDRLRESPATASPEHRRDQLDQQRQRVQHLALATDLLVVTALAAGGAALYLTWSGSESTSTALVIQPGQVAAVGRF